MIKRVKLSIATIALASMMLTSGSGVAVLAETASTKTESTKTESTKTESTKTENNEKKETTDYTDKAVADIKKGESLNIRKKGNEDASIVGKLKKGNIMTVIKKGSTWTKVKSGSVKGYVKNEYLVFGNDIQTYAEKNLSEYATVTADTLRVRKTASTDGALVTLVDEDKSYKVSGDVKDSDEWVKIKTSDGSGYVSADYVDVDYKFDTAKSMAQIEAAENKGSGSSSSSESSNGSSVLGYAEQFVGNPYQWGGSSLTNGCDCSGFVMAVYAHFGVSLPHSSGGMRGVGRSVSYSEMQPGDIVCYSGHVGIYAGGGQLLSALGEKWGITYNSVNYKHIVTIRRVL